MTVLELLEKIRIQDMATGARYSDGSEQGDEYIICVKFRNHGKPLEAKVDSVFVSRWTMFINATGTERRA